MHLLGGLDGNEKAWLFVPKWWRVAHCLFFWYPILYYMHLFQEAIDMIRRVKVENGWVRGLPAADPSITSYKGIPFAAKPIGPNRWRAPQPCPDWDGELFAAEFGPIPM